MVKFLLSFFSNIFSRNRLYYIVENADWSIKHDGTMITNNLTKIKSSVTLTHLGIRNSIVHYGSIGSFISRNKIKLAHSSNRIIVTWFHVAPNDLRIKIIPEADKYVDLWHTSCYSMKEKMLNMGIPEEKIVVIPLGVDTNTFKFDKHSGVKDLPSNYVVIGSFQKDGNGWGAGDSPKLIKGPDIFCEVVERLSKKYNLFVLLTGPSRGYVKKRLDKMKIQYRHDLLKDINSLADYYNSINLYIITSREEGGPKALLESLACGVPLVSTKVGMAPELIKHNENGYLVEQEDVEGLYKYACKILDNKETSDKFSINGLKTVKSFDWKKTSKKYKKFLYY
jgi:glycosyltransferase involved in cell wall biosynthesis